MVDTQNKIISIPVCWMLYEVPANMFEVLGQQVDRPSIIVIEAMVEQGLARRVKVITANVDVHDEEESVPEDADEEEAKEDPWWKGD